MRIGKGVIFVESLFLGILTGAVLIVATEAIFEYAY